jgi:hypothetical protein
LRLFIVQERKVLLLQPANRHTRLVGDSDIDSDDTILRRGRLRGQSTRCLLRGSSSRGLLCKP